MPQSLMPPTLDSVVVASDKPLTAPLGGEIVLLDPGEGIYFSLNEVGARVWELIEEPSSVQSICDRIVEEFEVDMQTCCDDILKVVSDLVERGLVGLVQPNSQ